MQPTPRRALAALVAGVALATAGCGGAGYGDPIAATGGTDATVALAPAPVTTPGSDGTAAPGATGGAPATTAGDRPPSTTTDAAPSDGSTGGAGDGTDDSGSPAGGGSDDVLASYAADANRFCQGFTSATRKLTTDIGAAGSNTKRVGRAIVRYGDAITAAASGLRAAAVPAGAGTYHQKTLDWVRGLTAAIRADRSGLQAGSAAAGAAVVQKVQDLDKPPLGSAVPAAVRQRATACAS